MGPWHTEAIECVVGVESSAGDGDAGERVDRIDAI